MLFGRRAERGSRRRSCATRLGGADIVGQRHPRLRRSAGDASPARPAPRTTSASTSTARRAGSRSRSRSTSRPIGRRAIHVDRRRRPARRAATSRRITFDTADPYTAEAERFAEAVLDGPAGPPCRRPTRSPTCASSRPYSPRPSRAADAGRRVSERSMSRRTPPHRDRAGPRGRRGRRRLGRLPARGATLRSSDADHGASAAAPRFVDEAAAAGVDHRYDGEFEYFVGGGVAVLDCDADGVPGPVLRRWRASPRRCTATAARGGWRARLRGRRATRRPTSTP